MAREPFNEEWANSPAPDQFEKPPAGTFASGWVGGAQGQLPEAKWENWWHNRVDAAMQQIERQGVMDWHPDAIYGVGGLARGSDGVTYRSRSSTNEGNNPTSDAVNWQPFTDWVAEQLGGQFQDYSATRTYTTGEIVRGDDGQFYEFYDRDQVGEVQGVDPTNAANRPHIWMLWDGVKPGTTIEWRSETLPEGYVENDGSEISRADYRRIYAIFGDIYGAGDGSTTFRMPDDRGEFKRGWDHGRGVDPGRSIAAHQMDQMQRLEGEISTNWKGNPSSGNSGVFSSSGSDATSNSPSSGSASAHRLRFDSGNSPGARVSSTTSGETRARNVAVIYLTKV